MNEKEILEITQKFVKEKCHKDVSSHDFWHIQRVYNNAIHINKKIGANEFVISMIAYMHDLYDHKYFEGDIESKLEETMKELNIYDRMTEDDIKNIIYSCANLGFSSNFAEKQELSIEGKIVQDADRLDGIGAIGIARVFAYGGEKGKPIHDPEDNENVTAEKYRKNGSNTSISHFYDKLFKIKDLMNTDVAKEIANNRNRVLEEFLKEFLDEWDGKK